MNQKCERLYTSAPLENNDLEQIFEKKLNDNNKFINHVDNIKELITFFKYKNNKSKKKLKNYKTKENIRINRLNRYYWSNVNFYNSIDYRY